MLSIKRKRQETVILHTLNGTIKIIVTGCAHAQLIFDAPKTVRILHGELEPYENS